MICLVDERISEKCERSLQILGARIIKLPPSDKIPVPMASHPDMLLFLHENEIIAGAEYCERYPYIFTDIREYSSSPRISFTEDEPCGEYPHDAVFNALTIGKLMFIKADTASRAIISYAERMGLTVIPTKQGYPACTVLAFGNSAITADVGMARLLEKNGINTTLIENGDVSLPPYEYGFIGGAAGVYKNKIYFLGDINSHRNAKEICEAVRAGGFEPISLSNEPLSDLGRILFID